MVSDAVRAFLNSNIVKDHPRMRSADFDFDEYAQLPEVEKQQIENILLSKLYAGHDARVLLALAELGTQKAIQPLNAFITRIRDEAGISSDGLIYQATVALMQVGAPDDDVIPHFISLLHHARMGNARREAAKMLANFDTPKVRNALAKALDDAQGLVRKEAAHSLMQIMGVTIDEDLLNAIRKNDETSKTALRQQAQS
jgi:HEAT repeat protein